MTTVSTSNTTPPTTPALTWPGWTLGALIATGIVVILAETQTVLVFLGVVLLGIGIYGAAKRRATRRYRSVAPSTVDRSRLA